MVGNNAWRLSERAAGNPLKSNQFRILIELTDFTVRQNIAECNLLGTHSPKLLLLYA